MPAAAALFYTRAGIPCLAQQCQVRRQRLTKLSEDGFVIFTKPIQCWRVDVHDGDHPIVNCDGNNDLSVAGRVASDVASKFVNVWHAQHSVLGVAGANDTVAWLNVHAGDFTLEWPEVKLASLSL